MAAPKIELHVHLEGTVRPATLLEIARRNDLPLPADTVTGLTELYRFTDFASFLKVWVLTTNCLRTAEDFRQITVDYAEQVAALGAVYVEAIFSPSERIERGVDPDELFTGYAQGAIEAEELHGVTIRFTPDMYRGLDQERAEETARLAVRYRDRGIVGLGLGGSEAACPIGRYATAFAIAADGGLGIVPHAGENAGAPSVAETLEFDPVRIRHGIWAVQDPELVKEIVDRGIVLDVCPTSNLCTGAVASLAEHPLPQLLAAGVSCTVNTDDPAMFGTDLAREYAAAAALGLDERQAFDAGLAGALCDQRTKTRLAGMANGL